jgi:uncharacterized protein YjiS (DUF1127 family)
MVGSAGNEAIARGARMRWAYGLPRNSSRGRIMVMRDLTRAATGRRPARRFDAFGGLVQRAIRVAVTWQRRCRERDQLAGLTERALGDIGLTRRDAAALARKPFWRK